jgi:hypothetical protein
MQPGEIYEVVPILTIAGVDKGFDIELNEIEMYHCNLDLMIPELKSFHIEPMPLDALATSPQGMDYQRH